MAATATATPRVAEEIAARLGLRDWVSIRSGFDRPNLTFDVVSVEGKGAVARKRAALMHVLGDPAARPAIVYCGTRKDTEEVAGAIRGAGDLDGGLPRGHEPGGAAREPGGVHGRARRRWWSRRTRSAWAWTRPTCARSPTGRCRRASRPTTRRRAAAGATAQPARALLLASRMDLGRLIRFIKERETSVEDVRRYRRAACAPARTASTADDRPRRARRARAGAAVDRRAGGRGRARAGRARRGCW